MTLAPELVRLVREDAVTWLRLDAPPLNAFDTAMRSALERAISAVSDDRGARVLVLAGNRHAFAAGADIEELLTMDFEAVVDWNRRLQQVFTRIASLHVPVVAAIRGYALGGGLELALCADYRIAGESAVVGFPEVTLGIMPGSGGTQRLTEIVGRSRSKELLMTGRRLTAQQALDLGIVDEVVVDDAVEARADEFARTLAGGPQLAVRAIKEAVDHSGGRSPNPTGLALERSLIAGLFATSDQKAGMRSFLDEGPGRATFD